MERDEWEAWAANPVTRKVRDLLKERHDQLKRAKEELDPRGYEDAHRYYADSLVTTARAEAYLAIHDSLIADAYDDIFEETE